MQVCLAAAALLLAPYGEVHQVPLPDGGVCRMVMHETGEYTSVPCLECLGDDGTVVWRDIGLPVRNDGAAGVVCAGPLGDILSACAFGEGYTDILIRHLNGQGNLLNEDTLAMNCYDTPLALVAAGDGFVLAWDSWSEERGVHLAFLGPDGSVASTRFAAGTVNPGPAALLAADEGVILVISPLLAQEDCLFLYAPDGELVWSASPELPEQAMLVRDILPGGAGTFTVVWNSLPGPEEDPERTVTAHSLRDGALL